MPDSPLRSQEVQEILSRPPHRLLQMGSMIMAAWMGVFVALSWFISYPEIVYAPAVLTTQTPPVRLISQVQGRLEKVCVADKMEVTANACLARLDHPLKEHTAVGLTKMIASIQNHLADPAVWPLAIEPSSCPGLLGNVQAFYAALQKAWQAYRGHLSEGLFVQKQRHLSTQMAKHQEGASWTERQLVCSQKHVKCSLEMYQAHQQLYRNGTISKQAWLTQQRKYLSAHQDYAALQNQLRRHRSEHQSKALELAALNSEHQERAERLRLELAQAVQSLQEQLSLWREQYIVETPIAGRVHRCQDTYERAPIHPGQLLFVVTDPNQPYVVDAWIPMQAIAKVVPGQSARIKLQAYPHAEFGHLMATVEDVSELPEEAGYRVRLSLCQTLKSTQGKTLSLRPELKATAEIVTEKTRLWQHLLYGLKKG